MENPTEKASAMPPKASAPIQTSSQRPASPPLLPEEQLRQAYLQALLREREGEIRRQTLERVRVITRAMAPEEEKAYLASRAFQNALAQTQTVLDIANRCFSGFIVGQTVNGFILGVLTWLGMRIFGMPYALMVAVLSGTSALIPIIGGYIGAALGTFLVFTANPSLALWFLLFIVALQTLQGNILYPRLVGNSVGIPSLWVLAAVSVGGGLGGIGGMMLAVPITATLYSLVHEWVQRKNADKKAELPSPVPDKPATKKK